MKNIIPISIWDKGQNKQAIILNAYVVNLQLNQSATFYYALLSEAKETLAQGNLTMDGDAYLQWSEDDNAWGWIAEQLNLTIVGDWVEPIVVEEIQEIDETISDEIRTSDEIATEEEI